ncbi:Uncharacterized conserved protein YeaO, DUF488 family [Oceanobacillus limi]|uniref:Uncharacterized conserved protein YeaO, DUF488 family n=1 Tax=Oceanobacillus limi TaxID=930131 RepID=A0A1I0GX47_9BACI|nr:DUF488 domain-containing protein [Oceanobacillus limi]SET75763.1 Uncharacterized conserved protein YeaO, DUF488 family [Oceanobacillus limi]
MTVQLKRAYEQPSERDGVRVLVDRIWPRGVSKSEAKIDEWMKKVAPSTELRKWFNHDPSKFCTFKEKYLEELETGEQKEFRNRLLQMVNKNKKVTLIYGAKDEIHNHAQVLKEWLDANKVNLQSEGDSSSHS